MSDNKTEQTRPAGAPATPVMPLATDGSVSLDDVDKIIDAEDPGFKDSLESIKKDAVASNESIESLDLDVEAGVDSQDEEAAKTGVFKKVLRILFTPFRILRDWLKMRWIAFANRTRVFVRQSWHFLKHDFPQFLKYLLSQVKAGVAWTIGWIKKFFALTLKQKALVVGSVASLCLAGFFLAKTVKGNWLPMWRNPLINSFADKAPKTFDAGKDGYVGFFDAFPEVEFHLLLTKMVVNLTPSPGIPNPMGAFEFYLGLDSNETAIEIKDREKEILDLTQRTLEEFTYQEVNTPATQLRIRARIRDNINEVLNQGSVKKVYVKTMITYRQ